MFFDILQTRGSFCNRHLFFIILLFLPRFRQRFILQVVRRGVLPAAAQSAAEAHGGVEPFGAPSFKLKLCGKQLALGVKQVKLARLSVHVLRLRKLVGLFLRFGLLFFKLYYPFALDVGLNRVYDLFHRALHGLVILS